MSVRHRVYLTLLAAVLLLGSCAPTRFLGEDERMLSSVKVQSDDEALATNSLNGYVRQRPNLRWFNLVRVPLGMYCIGGTKPTRLNRFFHRLGEAPVVYDTLLSSKSRRDIEQSVRNQGYLNAQVDVEEQQHKQRVHLVYRIHPGDVYKVRRLERRIDDPLIASLLGADSVNTLLHEGMNFDINVLDRERSRISSYLQNQGYYHFNKSFVRFEADTTIGLHQADLTLRIPLHRTANGDSLQMHRRYSVGRVNYLFNTEYRDWSNLHDTLVHEGRRNIHFYHQGEMPLSPRFLLSKTDLLPGQVYCDDDLQSTYSKLAALSAVMIANVNMEPQGSNSDSIDAFITLHSAKRHAFSAELEGTNSAGDLGAAVALGYQNRNLFGRSEMLSLEVRGAFEAIKGLKGYTDQNYIEYSTSLDFHFPEFKFPFLTRQFRRSVQAQSIASVMFDSQDRPEFHRRVLTLAWRYRWNRYNRKRQHRIDLVDLNYVFMPWISETFRQEYLMDNSSRNAVLRYNYENLFIMKWGYHFQYTSVPPTTQQPVYGQNAYTVRFGVETAGNLLYALSNLTGARRHSDSNAFRYLNIAYAQYVKFDFDWTKSLRIDDRNSLALHAAFGVAYPYGNSKVLPYEKRYFSGGANSVRGWSVRGLGPGKFAGSDGRVDFIRQTGDLKLDMSMEWRSHLFWKVDGAVFVDAGNIWELRSYEEHGMFRFSDFWKEIAVAYGLGIRFNFGYFILRLDGGMKAINPAYENARQHFPLLHPKFDRDFQLHFAVGLPF